MSRRILVLMLLMVTSAAVLAQGPPGPRPNVGPGPGPVLPPPAGIVLWPAGARIMQMFDVRGDELERALQDYPALSGVRGIRIVDYMIPGPPAPAEKILEFYAATLREPQWRPFFIRGGPEARAAYKGPGGFISVLARPRGATVTHIEGDVELSDLPMLEKVVRETVARRDPVSADVRDRVNEAMELRRAGKPAEAQTRLAAIIARHPMADIAHFQLALVLAEQRRYDEAGKHFRRAIALAPLNSMFRAKYGEFLAQRGDSENAMYELGQAASIDPWTAPVQQTLGQLYESRGMFEEAETAYRRLVELVGNSPEHYMQLGRVLEKEARTKEALDVYRDALKLKSDFAPAREAIRRLEK